MRPMMSRDLVFVANQLSHVKVMLRHILGHADLHAFVSGLLVSDITHRMIGFALLMYPFYG